MRRRSSWRRIADGNPLEHYELSHRSLETVTLSEIHRCSSSGKVESLTGYGEVLAWIGSHMPEASDLT